MIRLREVGEPINSSVLTDPVPCLNMVGMSVLCEPRGLCLLGCEEALLCLGSLVEALERVFTR